MFNAPIDFVLTQPLAETFSVDGNAPNVLGAHNMAHDALKAALGTDPEAAWALKVMNHVWAANDVVSFHAEFVRDPAFEGDA